MAVRELRWEDFPALTEQYWSLYDEVREDPELGVGLLEERPTLGEEAEWFAGLFRKVSEGRTIAGVAEEDGRAVGLCTVGPKGPHREERHIGLLDVTVTRAYRNRGIGRALLEHVLKRCRGRFELVELRVLATNARARHLYESLGFRTFGSQPRANKRGDRYIDDLAMQLDLSAPRGPAAEDPARGAASGPRP